jgi:N-terminal barrel of NtMGAM and CtMGAM, maltase-glucoamylase
LGIRDEGGGGGGAGKPAGKGTNKPPLYKWKMSEKPFGFEVVRADDESIALFNTSGTRHIFKDQYLELSTWVPPSASLYGLGEQISSKGAELWRLRYRLVSLRISGGTGKQS